MVACVVCESPMVHEHAPCAPCEARHEAEKKAAEKRAKRRAYARGRAAAYASVGMKRSRYGGWE